MNKLVAKLADLLPGLEARGSVYLFALVQREDVNRWDVMLSAAWSDGDYGAAVRMVADAVRAHLDASEITMLARVVIIPSDSPDITEMPRSLESIVPGDDHLIDVPLKNSNVGRMYVLKATRPSNQGSTAGIAAAMATHK